MATDLTFSALATVNNRKAPMQITLTRAMLSAKDACPEAFTDLEKFFGSSDNWTVDWTPEKQLEILKSPLRKYFGWGWQNQLYPMWCLRESDLSGADLSGSDLSGSDLSGSDLRGSNLSGSDLSGSNLSGSNLRWSNLSRSDLRESDLSGSNLSGSNLRWSNLRGSNLRGAKVCLCNSAPCIALRATLEAAGWRPGSD